MSKTWIPEIQNGVCINGCLPATDDALELCDALQAAAPSYSTVWEVGDMPIFSWDATFERYIDEQCKLHDEIRAGRKQCVLPWVVLEHLPDHRCKSRRFVFSQGYRPSCMGHGNGFARRGVVLTSIAVGMPFIYDPCNPIVTWYISKGESTRGGQNVVTMAKFANEVGHFPESLVGPDNINVPNYKQHMAAAKLHQTALVFLPGSRNTLADQIIKCCRAGLGVAIGNSTAVSGSTMDKSGVKIAVLRGSWAHATCFVGYRVVNGIEYVGWINSHGKIYGTSDEGEPADMCWMDRATLERFVLTATVYGQPYVVLPETTTIKEIERVRVPFPANWRA